MPSKLDFIPINNELLDKRVKLTVAQKQEILGFKDIKSQRELANMYGVSRRTIQFILDPQKLIENKQRRAERGGSKQYYDTEAHKQYMQKHRLHKKELHSQGKI
jgi:Zn-dependent peptidase ImmA (M78 family)